MATQGISGSSIIAVNGQFQWATETRNKRGKDSDWQHGYKDIVRLNHPTLKPSSWAQAYTEAVLPTPEGPVINTVLQRPSSGPASPWKSPQSHESARETLSHQKPLGYPARGAVAHHKPHYEYNPVKKFSKVPARTYRCGFLLVYSRHGRLFVSISSTNWIPLRKTKTIDYAQGQCRRTGWRRLIILNEHLQFLNRGRVADDFTWMPRTVFVCPEDVLKTGI